MKVLISGAGVGGPALAWWLVRNGAEAVIVERAPELRTGGYIIDFWGAGYDVAERMDLIPAILDRGYRVEEVRIVNREGRRISGFPVSALSRVAHDRYTSLPRGDLAEIIFRSVEQNVETIFGDSITSINQNAGGVRVAFEHAGARTFDLVIGADGLHSNVRRLVFGPDSRFEKYIGYKVAAFRSAGYRPRDELVYLMFTEVGQQTSRFSMRGDETMFLMIFADENPSIPETIDEQKAVLRKRFGSSGWECRDILEAMDGVEELYFDRVSQIRMDPLEWSAGGRVALVGDAASCVSLLAGEGTGLAIIAAYILAGELQRAKGDYGAAFARYRALFQPFVLAKQKAALRFAAAFAPPSKWSMFLHNQLFRLMKLPFVASAVAARGVLDDIKLPHYGEDGFVR
jgi:2-polyprenyl-6-methoxyphenol hydroxylase-like FAD-dependent oxidoreductase